MTNDKPLGISYLAQLSALNRYALGRPLRKLPGRLSCQLTFFASVHACGGGGKQHFRREIKPTVPYFLL
jgi:hypothetical protein